MRHFVAVVVECVKAAFLAIDVEHAVVSFAFVRRYLSGIIGHTVPVVIGHAAVPIHEVAAKEVSAGHPIGIRMSRRVSRSTHRNGGEAAGGCGRSRLVIVVHHIHISSTRTSIASVSAIIDHTIAEVDDFRLDVILPLIAAEQVVGSVSAPFIAGTAESGRAVVDMADEVVMERRQLSSPYTAVAVCPLSVSGIVQALADGTPLHREVIVVIEGSHLVDAP